MKEDDLHGVGVSEGGLSPKQGVEDTAKRVDVAAAVDVGAAGLFGAHELGRSADHADASDLGASRSIDHFCEAKIEDLDVFRTVSWQEEVLEFEVSVDDALGVCLGEAVCDL